MQSLLRECWRTACDRGAKLVQPASVLCASTRLGSKLSWLPRLDFLERTDCVAARFPFWPDLVSALWLTRGLGAKPEAVKTQHRRYCGVRDLYVKHKSSVALMIIWEAAELLCLNPGLYYLALLGWGFISQSLTAFILQLVHVPSCEGFHLMELM